MGMIEILTGPSLGCAPQSVRKRVSPGTRLIILKLGSVSLTSAGQALAMVDLMRWRRRTWDTDGYCLSSTSQTMLGLWTGTPKKKKKNPPVCAHGTVAPWLPQSRPCDMYRVVACIPGHTSRSGTPFLKSKYAYLYLGKPPGMSTPSQKECSICHGLFRGTTFFLALSLQRLFPKGRCLTFSFCPVGMIYVAFLSLVDEDLNSRYSCIVSSIRVQETKPALPCRRS